ncbi:leucine-rich repeat-containing protein 69, partial [Clarias magur]
LTELNLGNNAFEEMPPVLEQLHSLKKLYVYRNQIFILRPEVLKSLSNLIVLNLNHNKIRMIPPAIKSLSKLEKFSIADNQLEEIPAELGLVSKLTELNLARNKLSEIPQELYKLTHLRNLSLARNRLRELPEGILGWKDLKMFDVAGNLLSMFPADFHLLELKELYFEGNNLVRFEPVTSSQEDEVLSLKDMGIKDSKNIPVRVPLCSYSCFNKSGQPFYRVSKSTCWVQHFPTIALGEMDSASSLLGPHPAQHDTDTPTDNPGFTVTVGNQRGMSTSLHLITELALTKSFPKTLSCSHVPIWFDSTSVCSATGARNVLSEV